MASSAIGNADVIAAHGRHFVVVDDDGQRHAAVPRGRQLEVVVENADAPVTVSCQMLNRQDGAGIYAGTPTVAQKTAAFDPRKAEKISAGKSTSVVRRFTAAMFGRTRQP